ncbi:2-succinyl-5-enolpyruvyl-6-hydroxy-3-cyclohexene-1-carboxylic-acid synthase [Calidifontibacillus erzurumensis]|uniref:2-succinyl-5-enolpyruvyl-6-hydroxy-3-cyclohexene-1-carboxylate synthase n=1 Tax=Calidifontibacillus erzurumensis TaxID=2741433 RepID=A0A8J8GDH3_9BACI|nr:2-succinyl-5-enolpyruvyl-6-hydroxy-3-cyclohexene-1-carboxylic-acid synthase [Calidifontibacillus erzurumensis]NSL51372.1 2-succinyl-5-enolpyruvyl-6-hydroxy-3-cyclohexene-1-carboxylic-acid synthase [Calidifontibacillus erzurumensis]
MSLNKALTLYVAHFLDELVQAGVKNIVISPGSRSTPIAMLAAEHPDLKIWLQVDERSAAFFALGMAKASREPVAIVCTSGTAVANYMPAVVEAKESQVPLIVLTADRPHELRDIGAPQAIDQINFFGKQVKWFVEMAIPEDRQEMLRYSRTVAARAVAVCQMSPSGPVHLNFPFREPLVPIIEDDSIWKEGLDERRPFVNVTPPTWQANDELLEQLASKLLSIERGLIVCGPYDRPEFAETAVSLGEKLGFPVLADPLSQLRAGRHSKDIVIDSYDAFLRDEYIAERLKPEVVIRFGAMPVSKFLFLYLKNNPSIEQIIIDGEGLWRDPTLLAAEVIYADPLYFAKKLGSLLNKKIERNGHQFTNSWLESWITADRIAGETLYSVGKEEPDFEGRVVIELADCLPEQAVLFVGNSMPIRDVDSFFLSTDRNIRIMCNRGANGIDGTISTALGASTTAWPLVLLVGDLTFFHDLNGLLAAKLHELNATIVVVNNEGGGIFSFLPQSAHPKNFELLFGTPLGLDFSHAVKMYGGRFTRINRWNDLRNEITTSLASGGLNVIEIRTDRYLNVEKHRRIWNLANEKIKQYLQE